MLIYNHKKEFVGIDEKDLNILGFSSLGELMSEASDFADMFVKTPGFIHNFQHVNWIDFVECADSSESAKVIIHAKQRNFQCQLNVSIAYLSDNVSTKAYLVHLSNVKELTDNETEYISIDLLKQTTPKPIAEPQETPQKVDFVVEEEEKEDVQKEEVIVPSPSLDTPISLDFDDEIENEQLPKMAVQKEIQTYTEVYDNGYTYDPLVASSALGLPVDLIEEFIEDFIAQAKEFKDDLYDSFDNGDSDNLKTLSHKLKGVAANLRIEDALESLTIINTSDNNNEIKKHLDILYKIIAKLSHEEIVMTKEVGSISPSISNPKEPENENHIGDTPIEIDIDMDDNIFTVPTDEEVPADEEIPAPTITDAEVPTKIEMPELADDDFLAPIELNLDEDEISMNDVDNEIFEFDEVTQDISTESSEVPELNELEEFSLEPELDLAEDKLIHTPYDKKLVADEIGLDEESFNELFDDYIFEAKEISSLIRTAVDSNESNNWSKQALKLKMMNENMRITNLETELETLIQTQDRIIAQEASKKLSELILEIEA